MDKSRGGVALIALVTLLVVMATPATAANIAIASENTNTTDFNNATTLEDMSVQGSGDSAYVHYEGGASYLSTAEIHHTLDDGENPPVDEVNGLSASVGGDPTYVSGLVGSGAMDFSGGDYLGHTLFTPSSSAGYSVHATVNPDDVSSSGSIFFLQQGLIVRVQNGEMRYYHRGGGGSWNLVAQPSISADTTYDVGMSWDGSEVEAYLDGSQVGSASVSDIDGGAGDSWYMGHSPSESDPKPFDGVIDEPRIWQGHVTDNQFQSLANEPAGPLAGGGDGDAEYISQSHTVSQAADGKVNITTLSQATAYVEWQYNDGSSWQTHSNTSYTTSGVKTTDLSGQAASEWRVRVYTKDGDTNGLVDVQADWVTFENNAPVVDNSTLTPEGTQNGQEPTFSVDVTDGDFGVAQGETVNASLYVSGEYRGSDLLQTNRTASVTTQATGQNTYHWEVSDDWGASTQSDTVDIRTPELLYVFNSSSPHGLVDNVQVNATVTGSTETVGLRTDGDGTISLGDLPTNESYVFTLNAEGYHPREVYIEDLYDQQAAFLLSKDAASVENQFTITDRSGAFGEDTIIAVERVINTDQIDQINDDGARWVVMGGDRLGTSGFYTIHLHQYGRYRISVLDDAGNSRVLGEYTAKTGGNVNLEIGSVTYRFGDANTYQWTAGLNNQTDANHTIDFAYADASDSTANVSVTVKTRENGTVIGSQEFTNGPYGEVVFTAPVSEAEYGNQSFVVEWSAERNGEVITGSRVLGFDRAMGFPMAGVWKAIAYAAIVLVLGFFVGSGAGPAPALVTVGLFSGLAVYIGLAPPALGFGATILVVALGGIYTLQDARGTV